MNFRRSGAYETAVSFLKTASFFQLFSSPYKIPLGIPTDKISEILLSGHVKMFISTHFVIVAVLLGMHH